MSNDKIPRKWKHRLSGINESERTANCAECGPVKISRHHKHWRCNKGALKFKTGAYRKRYSELSAEAKKKASAYAIAKKRPYRAHVGSVCKWCGFVPVNKCQLDVDHIDGNHDNNDPANLQTLCANCHRLKTLYERNK